MSGYATPIGETKSYIVYLHVDCSAEFNKFTFKIERKSDDVDIDYSDYCSEEDKPDMQKFANELEESYSVFFIKDKGLRNKAEFEKKYQEKEQENIKLKEYIASLTAKIETIKRII